MRHDDVEAKIRKRNKKKTLELFAIKNVLRDSFQMRFFFSFHPLSLLKTFKAKGRVFGNFQIEVI
jgi:hypothetical protein